MPLRVLGPISFMEAFTSFSATTPWTQRTSLRTPAVSRKRPSGKTNSAFPRAVLSERTNCLCLATMRGSATRRYSHLHHCAVRCRAARNPCRRWPPADLLPGELITAGSHCQCLRRQLGREISAFLAPRHIYSGRSDTGSFTFSAPRVVTENFETVRVDDKLSDKDSLSATYLGDITPYSAPDALDDVLLSSRTNRQIGILEETHTFRPTLVNAVRFGFSRDAAQNNVGVTAINSMAKDPSLQAVPGQFAAQVVVPNTLTQFTGGLGANGPGRFHWNSFKDTTTPSGRMERTPSNSGRRRANATEYGPAQRVERDFNFSGLSNFLTNHPKRFTAARSANPTEAFGRLCSGLRSGRLARAPKPDSEPGVTVGDDNGSHGCRG